MFEKARKVFAGANSLSRKTLVIIGLVCAILSGIFLLFVLDGFYLIFPDEDVYSYLNLVATTVVSEKSTDFLENPDSLQSFIIPDDSLLSFYIETRNSRDHTITLELHGPHSETLTLVVTDEYNLVSLTRAHTSNYIATSVIAILFVSLAFGFVVSVFINSIAIVLKRFTNYINRIFKKFFKKEYTYEAIEPADNNDISDSETSEDEQYYAQDYDT